MKGTVNLNGIPPAWMISEILSEEARRNADRRPHLSVYIPPEMVEPEEEKNEENGQGLDDR